MLDSKGQKMIRPTDTMSIMELCKKYGFKYSYLYKWSVLKGVIPIYLAGGIKLSEQDVLTFEDSRRNKKYGWNK